jgi:alkylation response protein AidB-like acyl-CoA dehydrogenase
MTLDLSYSDEQQALAESVRRHCERTLAGEPVDVADLLASPYWSGLAKLGVLALGTEEGGGGSLEIAAAMEASGSAAAPGPVVGHFIATALLDAETRAPLIDGSTLVAVGHPPLVPWAPVASVFVELVSPASPGGAEHAWLARPVGEPVPVETTAGEPWGRVELARMADLGGAGRAVARGQVALAAYLVGAGRRLLDVAVEYARDRVQFGKSIGSFQAVAHPLAERATALRAAGILVRVAAFRLDTLDDAGPGAAATAARSASRAATEMAYQAHQTLGAMGFTIEGPVAAASLRIRQLSLHPPGPARARELVLSGLGI